jgi:hypothetical protein
MADDTQQQQAPPEGLKGVAGTVGTSVGVPWLGGEVITSPALLKLMAARRRRQPMSGLLGGAVANVPSEVSGQ